MPATPFFPDNNQPKLHISLVTETYPPEVNGVAMTVSRMVAGLRERGHKVSIIRPRQHADDQGCAQESTLAGLPIPGYPGLRLGLPAGRRLRRTWRHDRPDLVHVVTEGPLGWSAVRAARQLGIPLTSGYHTNFDRYSMHYGLGWMRSAVSTYLRTLHRRTAATLVPTHALAASLAGEGLSGVRVVGRGVDTQLFDPARRSSELRAEWGVHEGELACLYVGRLAAEKNLTLVLKSFAAIKAAHPSARMIWVGDGPLAASLQTGFPDQVFRGSRLGEDLARHYASADLFLFPSLSETYGNVVAEALASGVPVIAYCAAGAAELMVDGEHGHCLPPGDEQAFTQAASRLAKAPATRAQMSQAARQRMLGRSWDKVIDDLETVFLRVSAQGSTA